jgi:hypothetical protein
MDEIELIGKVVRIDKKGNAHIKIEIIKPKKT